VHVQRAADPLRVQLILCALLLVLLLRSSRNSRAAREAQLLIGAPTLRRPALMATP